MNQVKRANSIKNLVPFFINNNLFKIPTVIPPLNVKHVHVLFEQFCSFNSNPDGY